MENNDKIHDPLFGELFRIALPLLEGYHADLGHDTLQLARAVPGERYLWGVRQHGTEIRLLPEDPHLRSEEMRQTIARFPDHRWHVLEITAVRQDGYCAGTVTPLPPAETASPPRDPMHHENHDAPFSDGSRPSDPYVIQDNDQ